MKVHTILFFIYAGGSWELVFMYMVVNKISFLFTRGSRDIIFINMRVFEISL